MHTLITLKKLTTVHLGSFKFNCLESINFYTGNLYHTSEESEVDSICTHETKIFEKDKTFLLHVKCKFKFW